MTEDDTFLVLSRAPVHEMIQHYKDWIRDANGTMEDLETMCNRYGWTWIDFSYAGAEWREKYGNE